MEEDKGKKKYKYTYCTATGKEEIDVDENWYEILRQADRDMYNNNRREEYKKLSENLRKACIKRERPSLYSEGTKITE